MNPVLIYLAGPIDDIALDRAQQWREAVAAHAPTGVALFSPAHAFMNVNEVSFRGVDRVNRAVIHSCAHGVLANLMGPGRGFGTIREIEFARMTGTPVAVVGKIDSLMKDDIMVAKSLQEGLTMLLEEIGDIREEQSQNPFMRFFGQDS